MLAWEKKAQESFDAILEKIPVFLRSTAESKVAARAAQNALAENSNVISEKNLVDALFQETPFGFHGPLKNDLSSIGINYTIYGYDK